MQKAIKYDIRHLIRRNEILLNKGIWLHLPGAHEMRIDITAGHYAFHFG